MKILYVATVVKTHIMEFHIPYLKMLKEMGWETAVAARNDYDDPTECVIPYCDTYYDIPFERNPLKLRNIKAYKLLKSVIDEGHYDIIHCHTPVGAMLTRIAAKKARKNGSKVIYSAHGFHFYKGAPLKNWLLYYPVEWLCAHWTDTLITINKEDYALARKRMHAKRVEYVPGVGIDVDRFANAVVDRAVKRREIGVPEDACLLLSVGELNENKNHQVVIRALAQLDDKSIHYAIAGQGDMRERLQILAEQLGVEGQVHLLGYRTDVAELYKTADAYVLPSIREGLNVSVMEALSSGLPVICSKIRGNVDLVHDGESGFLCPVMDINANKKAIEFLFNNPEKCWEMGTTAVQTVLPFELKNVIAKMKEIYLEA